MSEVAALIAASPGDEHWRVVDYVTASPVAVGAREVAAALSIPMQTVRGHLTRAAEAGPLVDLGRGLHVGSTPPPGSSRGDSCHPPGGRPGPGAPGPRRVGLDSDAGPAAHARRLVQGTHG